jgi:hypothetical protein
MRRSLLICFTAAVLGVFAFTAPASAGGDSFPKVKAATSRLGPYSHEGAIHDIQPGDAKTFFVKVKNIGNEAGKIKTRGPAEVKEDAKFRYFRGSTDITSQVISGAGWVVTLDVGEARLLKVRARLTQDADKHRYNAEIDVNDAEPPLGRCGLIVSVVNTAV